MQHKRRKPYGKLVLAGLALALIGLLVALMTMNVPVKQAPVEQKLDAKTFLESQPQQQ